MLIAQLVYRMFLHSESEHQLQPCSMCSCTSQQRVVVPDKTQIYHFSENFTLYTYTNHFGITFT